MEKVTVDFLLTLYNKGFVTLFLEVKKMIQSSKISVVVACVAFAAMAALFLPTTVDDSYIFFRFSENLAQGHGLAWNPGQVPVEGYTNFMWVVIGAVIVRDGQPG